MPSGMVQPVQGNLLVHMSRSVHGYWPLGITLPGVTCSVPSPAERVSPAFSFPSLAAYEQYRRLFGADPDFIEADRIRDDSGCVLHYERTFMRPVLPRQPVQQSA
jgi:hypothetical protein